MEEIMAFLKENPTFYFATVEGYKPRVRPFGFAMEYKGRLYFAIGKHKAAYKQILDNTNIEICTANDRGEWILTTRKPRRSAPLRSCPSWPIFTIPRAAWSWAWCTWIG